jgi:hypothetical protein
MPITAVLNAGQRTEETTDMTDTIITINGRRYAPNKRVFMNALFQAGGTFSGEYRVRAAGVLLLDQTGAPFAFVVNGRKHGDSPFIVTAFRQDDGRTRYMYSTTERTRQALGMTLDTCQESYELAREILRQAEAGR